MRVIRVLLVLALVGVALVLIFQNTAPAQVSFFAWSYEMPLAAALCAALAVGFLAGALAAGLFLRRARRRMERIE